MRNTLRNVGRIILVVLAISCGAVMEVRAGTITAADIAGGCPGTTIVDLPVAGKPLSLDKDFTSLCNKDIVFTVMNSGALATQSVLDTVNNLSMATWFDFHMRVGFGVGNQFQPIPANCSVAGFATVPFPMSGVFMLQGVNSTDIDFRGGGTVPPDGNDQFTFSLNLDDLKQCVPAGSQLANGAGFTFTLRETPTTPEPTTMLLLGTGLAGLALKARKRGKIRKRN